MFTLKPEDTVLQYVGMKKKYYKKIEYIILKKCWGNS